MYRRRQRLEQATKKAARPLGVCVIVILGTTGLILQSTMRSRASKAPEPLCYSELPGVDLQHVSPERRHFPAQAVERQAVHVRVHADGSELPEPSRILHPQHGGRASGDCDRAQVAVK
jgi:hypothetical protein